MIATRHEIASLTGEREHLVISVEQTNAEELVLSYTDNAETPLFTGTLAVIHPDGDLLYVRSYWNTTEQSTSTARVCDEILSKLWELSND